MPGAPGGTAATLRLIAAPGLKADGYEAGVDIAMSAGSHTYWKMPGEAGVPPVFAFDASENVAAATVLFPVPRRLTEDGLDAFGYTNEVVFPVRVTPLDPAKPAVLRADVMYAVCNKICLPEHDAATLTLEPKAATKDTAADVVAAAFAQVPELATSEQQAALSVARRATAGDDTNALGKDTKPSWTLIWRGRGTVEDIFAEGPDGFFFTTKKTGEASWTLVAEQSTGPVAARAVPVSLTLRQKTGGLVLMETLDVTPSIQ